MVETVKSLTAVDHILKNRLKNEFFLKKHNLKKMISQSFLLFLHLLENSESTSSIELGNKVFSFFLCDILFNNGRDIKKNLITLAQVKLVQ